MKTFFLGLILLMAFSASAQKATVRVAQIPNVKISYYTASVKECGNANGITAHGPKVHDGVIACNFLPKGVRVRIPSLYGKKIFTVYDKLNTGLTNNVDIYVKELSMIPKEGIFFKTIEVLD